jgi:hypothetical protein
MPVTTCKGRIEPEEPRRYNAEMAKSVAVSDDLGKTKSVHGVMGKKAHALSPGDAIITLLPIACKSTSPFSLLFRKLLFAAALVVGLRFQSYQDKGKAVQAG